MEQIGNSLALTWVRAEGVDIKASEKNKYIATKGNIRLKCVEEIQR